MGSGAFAFFLFLSRLSVFPTSTPSSRPLAAARARISFTDTVSDGSRSLVKIERKQPLVISDGSSLKNLSIDSSISFKEHSGSTGGLSL